jgi:macrolide transport system ATP-binding/permease protein
MVQSDERLLPIPEGGAGLTKPARKASGFRLREQLEDFNQGFRTLAANKVRTALSMLGILIGVAAVVAMLALGRGAQNAIEAQLASLGSNLLVLRQGALRVGGVSQGAGMTTRITFEDVQAIRDSVDEIRESSPTVSGRVQVTFADRNWSTQVQGTTSAYARMHAAQPDVGRFFSDDENQKRTRVAVVGRTVVRELFGSQNPIGEMIKINRVNFQIIGLLPEKGANGFRDQDDNIVIPLLTAMHRLLGKDYVDTVDFEIRDPGEMESSQERILDTMFTRHRVPPSQRQGAFEVRNMADIQAALSESSKTMSALLASIAAISLLVGGIGIMNIMLVSVTERTREIGLRKAVGARRWDILSQFLIEAVVISAVGGVIGIILGWLITVVLSAVAGWTTAISIPSVVVASVFSATIGVVFGIYPARQASLLHPIQALRHE